MLCHQLLIRLFSLLLPVSVLSAQPAYLGLEDLRQQVQISSPALSPDGTKAVFITTRSDFDHNAEGAMLLVGSEADQTAELYFKASPEAAPVPLAHFNEWMAGKQPGKSEGFEWQSTDGFRPDGVLTYPPDFDPEKKYPLVLLIHGGPTPNRPSCTFPN